MTRTSVLVLPCVLVCAAACTDATALSPSLLAGTPRIDGIEIEIDSAGFVLLTAHASDELGRALVYNWGSRALDPPVRSESQVVLDGVELRGNAAVAHLVVQDVEGRLASARVLSLVDGTYGAEAVPDRADEPCVLIHDRCVGACAVEPPSRALDRACASECAVRIALCRTKPS